MEMNIRNDRKLVEIWLSKNEKNDLSFRKNLTGICDRYKQMNYLVAVFESGNEDLFENTLNFLVYNRKRKAEKEVRQEKLELVAQ